MILGLIPVRLKSRRLANKALLDLAGLPMIIHTYRRAMQSKKLDDAYVCTDSQKIIETCKNFGAKWIKTSSKHKNGTERIAEAAKKFKNCTLIVDIQGDEPLINPKDIDRVIEFHKRNKNFDIVVPYQITDDKKNINIVKIASFKNKILNFSRLDVPFNYTKKSNLKLKKHLSIISFIPLALKKFSTAKLGDIEKIEGVELIRALEMRLNLGTFKIAGKSFSVDVLEDYLKAVASFKKDRIINKYIIR